MDERASHGTATELTMKYGDLMRTKPLQDIINDSESREHKLNRVLGPGHLILFGIGAIIGAGIFATIGTAAAGDAVRLGAGPALMVSFLVTAVVCGFTALCYAEFASIVPISGSAYTYSYTTLGELIAWVIGWDLIIEYAVGNIAVAISWANYFKTLLRGFGLIIPDWISMDYRTAAKIVDAAGVQTVYRDAPHVFGIPIVFNILAMGIVALITVVLVWGIKESANFNAIMVGIKIVVLIFFIVIGSMWVKPENWTPFAPNGWAGVSAGAAIVFFAFIGFDAVSTVAEETKDPQRNLPIGILGSLAICTVFYVIVSAVFTGLISFHDLQAKLAVEQAEPLTMALEHASPTLGWAVGIVAFGSVVAHTAVLLVFQLGQPRIFFSMARDGLLPPIFEKVRPRFRTPLYSTIITAVVVALIAAFASIDEMVDLTNIGTLFAFILVCAGIIALRIKDPDRHRPFRVPGGWAWAIGLLVPLMAGLWFAPIPELARVVLIVLISTLCLWGREHVFAILGILSCLYLIYYLPPTSWLRFAAWLNLGFVIYAGYGLTHSRLSRDKLLKRSPERDAFVARTGALLLLLGTGLLFSMRAFDVFLTALPTYAALPELGRYWAALAEVFSRKHWIEVSWFLIVPMALNAFVLCPVILTRGLRARSAPRGAEAPFVTGFVPAVAVVVLTLAYFFMLIVHHMSV